METIGRVLCFARNSRLAGSASGLLASNPQADSVSLKGALSHTPKGPGYCHGGYFRKSL